MLLRVINTHCKRRLNMELTKTKRIIVSALVVVMLIASAFILSACGSKTTSVSTYQELVDALAGKSEVVKLTKDIVVEDTIVVAREVVLDLNGKQLSNTNEIWDDVLNKWSLISVRENGNLTIKGDGKLLAKENDCYAVDVMDGGNLVVEGGEFVGNIHAVYVYEGNADIKGGKYSIQQVYSQDKPYEFVLNLLDGNRENGTAKITVTGGTFVGFNPQNNQAEGPETNFVAEGYVAELAEGSTDTYVVKKA